MTAIKRNRTIRTDLDWLMRFINDPRATRSAPRLELSWEDGQAVAQIMADHLAVPLVGRGLDAPAALRDLVDNAEAAAKRRRARSVV